MHHLNMAPETEGDGRKWQFIGIWSRNRWEWLVTHFANMYFNYTSIGFFDSMGPQTTDYILEQTGLQTMFVEGNLVKKLIQMCKDGYCKHLKTIVSFDSFTDEEREAAKSFGIDLMAFEHVRQTGADKPVEWKKCSEHDFPLFSYTSGTTGDSKGVKLTHRNLVRGGIEIQKVFAGLNEEDSYISYLPYPHSFEQCLLYLAVCLGMKIGYY